MGNTWEVYGWIQNTATEEFEDVLLYAGESQAEAWKAAEKAKADGVGYVKIEWR